MCLKLTETLTINVVRLKQDLSKAGWKNEMFMTPSVVHSYRIKTFSFSSLNLYSTFSMNTSSQVSASSDHHSVIRHNISSTITLIK